jgi:hypothetical protein
LVQANIPPLVPEAYDGSVVRLLGADQIVNAVWASRTVFLTKPTLKTVERTKLGTLVSLSAVSNGSTVTYSYLLQRRNGGWLITYDSLLAEVVKNYVTAQVQNRINRNASHPSATATAAGEYVLRRYVALFTPGPHRGRLGIGQ